MAWFSNKITVTFINATTSATIDVTQIPPNDLPESFELETTMQLGDSSWIVADAIPKTRVEYSKSKKLTLHLNQVLSVNPQTILFSLSTICDYNPGLGNQALTGQELVLHEDDWQQFEFISKQLVFEIDQEIESIRQIYANESVGGGFRKLHVRKLIKKSIVCDLTLSDLTNLLGIQAASNGVTYQRSTSQIEAGFSITAPDGLRLYGLTENGMISVLAIAEESLDQAPEQSIVALQSLATTFDLDLLHWSTCGRASGTDPGFRRLFTNF